MIEIESVRKKVANLFTDEKWLKFNQWLKKIEIERKQVKRHSNISSKFWVLSKLKYRFADYFGM